MQLIPLNDEAQLNEITSGKEYQVILKHNTDCPISQGVLNRLKADEERIDEIMGVYVLDLHSNRSLSDNVAGRFGVPHQSPQVLVVKNGRCVYHEWGFDITADAIREAVGGR
jgi:bacillithiol system protein YtxJ